MSLYPDLSHEFQASSSSFFHEAQEKKEKEEEKEEKPKMFSLLHFINPYAINNIQKEEKGEKEEEEKSIVIKLTKIEKEKEKTLPRNREARSLQIKKLEKLVLAIKAKKESKSFKQLVTGLDIKSEEELCEIFSLYNIDDKREEENILYLFKSNEYKLFDLVIIGLRKESIKKLGFCLDLLVYDYKGTSWFNVPALSMFIQFTLYELREEYGFSINNVIDSEMQASDIGKLKGDFEGVDLLFRLGMTKEHFLSALQFTFDEWVCLLNLTKQDMHERLNIVSEDDILKLIKREKNPWTFSELENLGFIFK